MRRPYAGFYQSGRSPHHEQNGSYNDFGANLAAKPCPVRISIFNLHHLSKEDQQEQINVSYMQVACNRAFLIAVAEDARSPTSNFSYEASERLTCSVLSANQFLVDKLLNTQSRELAAISRVLDPAERQVWCSPGWMIDKDHASINLGCDSGGSKAPAIPQSALSSPPP
jgi:hypothetical protein